MVLIIALTTLSWLLNPPLLAGEIVFVLLQIHIFVWKKSAIVLLKSPGGSIFDRWIHFRL